MLYTYSGSYAPGGSLVEHLPGPQTMGSVLPMEMTGPVVTGVTSGFFPLFILLPFNFIYLSIMFIIYLPSIYCLSPY